jgi:hypothetical protein
VLTQHANVKQFPVLPCQTEEKTTVATTARSLEAKMPASVNAVILVVPDTNLPNWPFVQAAFENISMKKWVANVDTDSTHPPKDLFTKDAETIAKG